MLTSCWRWRSNCVHLQWEATQSLCPARCHRGHSLFVQSVGWKLARTQYMQSMCTYLLWDAPPVVTFNGIGNIEWCQPASSVGFYIFGSHRVDKAIITQHWIEVSVTVFYISPAFCSSFSNFLSFNKRTGYNVFMLDSRLYTSFVPWQNWNTAGKTAMLTGDGMWTMVGQSHS